MNLYTLKYQRKLLKNNREIGLVSKPTRLEYKNYDNLESKLRQMISNILRSIATFVVKVPILIPPIFTPSWKYQVLNRIIFLLSSKFRIRRITATIILPDIR